MSGSEEKNTNILKMIIVFIVVFFLFIIIFNIWMQGSMEKSGVASSSQKPQTNKMLAPMQEQVMPSLKTGIIEKKQEGTSRAEGQLILQ
ncbi:MAG: hypothetical protein PHI86_02100 [Candidatus Omnitrophica bacterium]|nr:hypothetical protein [Candidatus Omnitrophota bacterium]